MQFISTFFDLKQYVVGLFFYGSSQIHKESITWKQTLTHSYLNALIKLGRELDN